jgi:hypothetical protein
MYYITYVKQTNEPLANQMSFDDFYKSFYEGITIPEPAFAPIQKQQFRTIAVNTISDAYVRRFGPQANGFARGWLHALDAFNGQDMHDFYTSFQIPKHSGGMRTINAPNETTKSYMTRMLKQLQQSAIYENNAAYAYVQNRCPRDAVALHQETGHEWFIKLDLHDFFGSCNPTFTKQQLLKIPFFAIMHEETLDKFIHFISLNNGLPQGSPLSPWITNQIMVEFDYHINRVAHAHNLTYTRYADDMLFSGASKNAVRHAEPLVKANLANTPLHINTEKTRISSIYGQNWNLGIMLNKDHNITIGYKKKERLRATLHNFIANTQPTSDVIWSYQECTELLGLIQYFHTIEPEYIEALLTKYNQKYNIDIRSQIISIIKQGA